MKILITVLVLVAGALALESSIPAKNAAPNLPNNRIGGEAKLHAAPYIVSIHIGPIGIHHCAGSIIDYKFVLTAANCVTGLSSIFDLYATAGLHEWTKKWEGQTVKVAKRIVHENFNAITLVNNIALLKMETEFKIDDKIIGAISMNSDSFVNKRNCILYGWSSFNLLEGLEPELRAAYVTSWSSARCRDEMPWLAPPVLDTNVCSHDKGSMGLCYGGTGSPLVCSFDDDNPDRLHLTGILSWEPPQCDSEYPTLYTNVASFTTWIYYAIFTNQ